MHAAPAPARSGDGVERAGRVCMFVYNNCSTDARVFKEAGTLSAAGYEVHVIAVLDRLTVPTEDRDAIHIVRIDRNPPHYKLLRATRAARRRIRLRWAGVKRRARVPRKRFVRWF